MDPITIIFSALTAAAGVVAKAVTSQVVKDGYEKLKAVLFKQSGPEADGCIRKFLKLFDQLQLFL